MYLNDEVFYILEADGMLTPKFSCKHNIWYVWSCFQSIVSKPELMAWWLVNITTYHDVWGQHDTVYRLSHGDWSNKILGIVPMRIAVALFWCESQGTMFFFSMFFLPLNDLLVILYIAMENHHFEWLSINHLQYRKKKNHRTVRTVNDFPEAPKGRFLTFQKRMAPCHPERVPSRS